jgi:hypothetical protein
MALIPLVNKAHCIAAGFCINRTVKFIDSMNMHIVDVGGLINQLNAVN